MKMVLKLCRCPKIHDEELKKIFDRDEKRLFSEMKYLNLTLG